MIIITGQTATGKTKLALELAKEYNGELINFDSRQMYKYLDIITGKDKDALNNVAIWLYDIVTPNQYFSSFDFVEKAKPIISDVIKRGNEPILVGGTYLYLKHLLYGIDDNNSPPNFKLREELNNKTVEELQNILKKLDVQLINQLNNSDKNNPRRLIRRIEICENVKKLKGLKVKKLKCFNIQTLKLLNLKTTKFIGIMYKNKEDLISSIKARVEKRLKQGAIKEVKSLLEKGYKETDPGMKTIGYQEIIQYLNGKITKEQAAEQWTNHEIQYAKRQLTFMKKDKNIVWKEI
jgi:tRNA dimethylallyltransferase